MTACTRSRDTMGFPSLGQSASGAGRPRG
jgi:hypothetical protein